MLIVCEFLHKFIASSSLDAKAANAKAAKEILHVRNSDEDAWKLYLHGLHASKTGNILKEHLHGVETRVPVKQAASADEMCMPEHGSPYYPSFVSGNVLDMEGPPGNQ